MVLALDELMSVMGTTRETAFGQGLWPSPLKRREAPPCPSSAGTVGQGDWPNPLMTAASPTVEGSIAPSLASAGDSSRQPIPDSNEWRLVDILR